MENQNVLEYEIEMATLDLKGRRYREAVDKFSDLARMTNNAGAWSGLALAKLGLITEDVTVVEVFHCFTKALYKSEKKEDIYTLSIEAAKEAIKELYEVYVKAILISREAKKDAFKHKLNSVAGAFFTVDSHMSKRNTSSAIGAGLTALSYNGYLNSKNTAEEFNRAAERLKDLISEIVEQTKDFNSDNNNKDEIKDFKEFVEAASIRAVEMTKTEEEKKSDELRKIEEEKMKQKYLPAADAEELLNDNNHIYHLYKRDAKSLYEEGKLAEAYEKITYAHQIYSLEVEVSSLKQQYENELKQKNADRYKKDKRIFFIFMIIVLAVSLLEGDDGAEIGSNLFYMAIFGATVLVYRKVMRDNVLRKPVEKQ